VAVGVGVGAPVVLAALVNGNKIVKVFDAVRRSGLDELRELATMRSSKSTPHSYNSLSTSSSTFMTSRCAAHSIASDVGHHRRRLRPRLRALITATASFQLTSAATTTGATTATATATEGAAFHTTGFERPFLGCTDLRSNPTLRRGPGGRLIEREQKAESHVVAKLCGRSQRRRGNERCPASTRT
jgi:hypothetical protein